MSEHGEQPDRPTGVVKRLCLTVGGFAGSLQHSMLSLHMRGKVRRFWLVNLRPGYVRRQRARRKGDCHQCGVCCKLGYTCPVLHANRQCMVYHGYRPTSCCEFPLDEQDIRDVEATGGKCGYFFDGP